MPSEFVTPSPNKSAPSSPTSSGGVKASKTTTLAPPITPFAATPESGIAATVSVEFCAVGAVFRDTASNIFRAGGADSVTTGGGGGGGIITTGLGLEEDPPPPQPVKMNIAVSAVPSFNL